MRRRRPHCTADPEVRVLVLGMMSGTSVDAIDAAIVRIEESGDELAVELIAYHEQPHDEGLRRRVHALFDPAASRTDELCECNVLIGEAFAAVGRAAIGRAGVAVDLVASHGQTVWHQVAPDGRVSSTLQIGEPSTIAERLGATVVADFRPRDVAAGGQGAPLASYPDILLFADPTRTRAIQNLGGIGNATYLPPGGDPTCALAFDTGPANALIDHAVWRLTGGAQQYDVDGAMAARGRVADELVDELMALPFFDLRPPKSTGRELFGAQLVDPLIDRALGIGLSPDDVVATLTAFTVRTVSDQYRRFLPTQPDQVVLGGGGSRNPTLRRWLAEALAPAELLDHDDFGLPSTGREAIYFAVMGYQALHGRPNTVPACTGAAHPVVMGKIVPGPNYPALARAIRPEVSIRRMRVVA
jgi:anhydro-N-acetylmuramic acid kinase